MKPPIDGEKRNEILWILCLLGLAALLMFFVAPGLQESPYNEF